jgi:tRNA (uracil-5-)-methyltransferase TRM9
MNDATVRALAEINRTFYRERAREFSAARAAPWPGWQALVAPLRERAGAEPLRVLDVGCGNGRFARFLASALPDHTLALWGVDASEPLLDEARRAGPEGARWQPGDIVAEPEALPAGPFDAIALLNVIHGVPGRARRRDLLAACARRLAPGGLLVLTTWRFTRDERVRGRVLPWNAYSSRAPVPIDCSQLEPGDHLLPWGDGDQTVRYIHAFDDSEIAACIETLPLALERRYTADGRTGDQNEYFLLRAP